MRRNQKGFTLVELLVVLTIFCLVTLIYTLLLNNERAKARDAKRMADMVKLSASFELLLNEKNSYAEAAQGCSEEGAPASSCNLSKYWPDISKLSDPGKFEYLVTTVPNQDDYGISFQLERGYNGLSAGQHILSPRGIK